MRQHEWALDQETSLTAEPRRHLYVVASLLRRWKAIASCAVVALLLAGLVVALKPLTYTATTQLLIYNRELQPGPEPVITPGRADTALVENMIEIFKSRTVLAKVIETLKLNEDADAASTGGLGQLVRDWMAPAPPKELSEEEKSFERAIESFRQALWVRRAGTSHTVLVTFTSSDPRTAAAVANEIAVSAARVFRSTESGSSGASPLRERLQGLGPSAYVISEADPPVRPDGMRRVNLVALFLLAGLGLGAALALFLDFMDRTIRTPAQVEGMLGLECFGTVTRMPAPLAGGPGSLGVKLPTRFDGNDQWRRSLAQALRRALTVTDSILAMRTVGVTSIDCSEARTTMAASLGRIAADAGKKVLMISVAKTAGAAASAASADGSPAPTDVDDAVRGYGSHSFEHLHTITLEADDPLDDVIRNVAPEYDLIVVDLPPLSSDPAVKTAAAALDGILLILEWGRHSADDVRLALERSDIPPAKFAGVILDSAPRSLIGRYGDTLAGVQARLGGYQPNEAKADNRRPEQCDGLAPV